MIFTETRSVKISLVVRLDDILTGMALWPEDDSLRVFSDDGLLRAIAKSDGYFVFVGRRPEMICVKSSIYQDFSLSTEGLMSGILRVAMLPKESSKGGKYEFALAAGESAHIGFSGVKSGYPLTGGLMAGAGEIALQKEDFSDLTGMFHALTGPDGQIEPVFISKSLGGGRYALAEPLKNDYPMRATRLLPLRQVVGGLGGTLAIPLPDGCEKLLVLRMSEAKGMVIKWDFAFAAGL